MRSKTAQLHYENGINAKLSGVPFDKCRPHRCYEGVFKQGYDETIVSLPEASNELNEVFSVAVLSNKTKDALIAANGNPVLIQRSNRTEVTNEYVLMTRERFEQLIKDEEK